MIKLNLLRLTEQTLAITLTLLFVAPLLLTVIRNLPVKSKASSKVSHWLDSHWIGEPHLIGVTEPEPDVPFTWHSLRTGEFQKQKASQFNTAFAGRELLIRYTNELWLRIYHEAANYSSQVVIGKHDSLFGKGYLLEYFFYRIDKSAVEPWVKDLRRLQDFCRSIGMGFVVVITPGKASVYPEDTPRGWQHCYDPRPRTHFLLAELFRKHGIVFVDGIDLTAREKLKGPPAPVFPKGGMHWNSRAAVVTSNAILARLAEQGKPLWPIEIAGSSVSNEPTGDDCDILQLMNLVRPWKYPCERMTIKPAANPGRLNMAAVGGSFTWTLLHQFMASRQFADIDFFFYYKVYKTRETDYYSKTGGANSPYKRVREPATPVDFSREIFAADCLLLEINEATAPAREHFLSVFLRDALAHLPDPAAPRPAFRPD